MEWMPPCLKAAMGAARRKRKESPVDFRTAGRQGNTVKVQGRITPLWLQH
jgi:hypothetical protein